MTFDPYGGDPRLMLTQDGADIDYEGGQPVMDQGVENQALISLFTDGAWFANAYIADPKEQIGSDFESTCRNAITLKSVTADIPNAAELALESDYFPSPKVSVTNPSGSRIEVQINLNSGVISASKIGMSWTAQAQFPASGRLVKQT